MRLQSLSGMPVKTGIVLARAEGTPLEEAIALAASSRLLSTGCSSANPRAPMAQWEASWPEARTTQSDDEKRLWT